MSGRARGRARIQPQANTPPGAASAQQAAPPPGPGPQAPAVFQRPPLGAQPQAQASPQAQPWVQRPSRAQLPNGQRPQDAQAIPTHPLVERVEISMSQLSVNGSQAAAVGDRNGRPGQLMEDVISRDPKQGRCRATIRSSHTAGDSGAGPRPGLSGRDGRDTTSIVDRMDKMSGMTRGRRRGDTTVMHTRPTNTPTVNESIMGVPVQLLTNFFLLTTRPGFALYQYHVDFIPDSPSIRFRKAMMKVLRDKFRPIYTFDGMQMFTPARLVEGVDGERTYQVLTKDGQQQQVKVKLTAEVQPDSPTMIQQLNLIFRQVEHILGYEEIRRNYYMPSKKVILERHRLEVWPGFVASIANYQGGLMLTTEIKHKIMRTDTVLDVCLDIMRRCRNPGAVRDEVKKALLGQIVMTRFNNKTYRVDDVMFGLTPMSTFDYKGKNMTYVDYYKQKHNLDINDRAQLMLVSKCKLRPNPLTPEDSYRDLVLVPELCTMTGLTEDTLANFQVMKDLAVHTRLDPTARVERIRGLLDSIQQKEEARKTLSDWGVAFANDLLAIQGMVVPEEIILMGTKKIEGHRADWSGRMRGLRVNNPMPLQKWLLVYPKALESGLTEFRNCVKIVTGQIGMALSDPLRVVLEDDRAEFYVRELRARITPEVQMVVCILPTNRKDRYDAIKKHCCLVAGVPSQCILAKSLSKQNATMSIVTKVVLQMNCKMGGDLWGVAVPNIQRWMICGFDTYHDSGPRTGRKKSVGAFLATFNRACTQYYSRIDIHDNMEEFSNFNKLSMTAALRKYHSVNNCLPDKVIFYRDGVGDGDLKFVYETEVKDIESAIKAAAESQEKPIGLAFVVVKKRISTRFFVKEGQDNFSNPRPGTVVDSGVTRPEWYDFFLVSQSVRQGTVTPTHFNVIFDESGFKIGQMQRLAYKMCHLYYNWQGTVRVPAPCQYAHKLAYLVGTSLHTSPRAELHDKLFFL